VLKVFRNPADGEVISLKDGKDIDWERHLQFEIANFARRFSRRRQDLDQDFFRRRIAQASEYRDAKHRCKLRRVVWSEATVFRG